MPHSTNKIVHSHDTMSWCYSCRCGYETHFIGTEGKRRMIVKLHKKKCELARNSKQIHHGVKRREKVKGNWNRDFPFRREPK